ncbi:Protein SYS1 [Cladobotryum mycophilum]|uniref:Protein SYS1 n=1 Tax=Cladobotryum mycophilum TaxID=491253 RepID=A0ABR0SUT1_9HYPO
MIAAQILTLQALYYAAALVLLLFTTLVAGMPFSLDLLLGWERVRGDTTTGWLVAFIWILDGGLCMSVAIVILIARSKLVPDFALTVHGLHLVFTTLYTHSLPRNSMWWVTMLSSSAIAVGLGMWGCRYRELQPVFFFGGRVLGSGMSGPSTRNNNGGGNNNSSAAEEGLLSGQEEAEREEYELTQVKSAVAA